MQKQKRLAIMIAGGDDKEDSYSDMSKEGLDLAMKKLMSAFKDGNVSKANEALKTWKNICEGEEDEDFKIEEPDKNSDFDDGY